MLRKLTTIFLIGILALTLITTVQATPAPEETVHVTIGDNQFVGEVATYGYDEEWKYQSNTQGWISVRDVRYLPESHQGLALALRPQNQSEGYKHFQQAKDNPEYFVTLPEQDVLDKYFTDQIHPSLELTDLPVNPAVVRLQQPSAWYQTCLTNPIACWVDHRYNRDTDEWEWNGQLTTNSYNRNVGGSEFQQQVQNALMNFDQNELGGYEYLQMLAENRPEVGITGLPDGFRPGQGDTTTASESTNLPETPPVINVDYDGRTSVDFRYSRDDRVWQYNGGAGYGEVQNMGRPYPEEYRSIARSLATSDELEGYQLFYDLLRNPPRNLISISGANFGELLGQGDTTTTTPDRDPDGPGTPTTPTTPRPTTTPTTNECGANGEYFKFCFQENKIGASNFASDNFNEYIQTEIRAGRAQEGFVLIVFAPEDRQKTPRSEQRVRIAREHKTTREVQAATPQTHRLLTLSYARAAPGEHPSAAYLVPDTKLREDNAPLEEARKARTNNQLAEALLTGTQTSIQEVYAEQWRVQATEFRGSEELTRLSRQLYEQKGIPLFIATHQQEWEPVELDITDDQIREQIQLGNANVEQANYGGGINRAQPDNHPLPCAAYLLLDPAGISLYDSSYCPIRHARHQHRDEEPITQATRLLRSIIQQTQALDAQTLFLEAYRLAEEDTKLHNGEYEAEVLVNLLVNNPYFRTQSQREMQASKEIVLAKQALVNANPQLALQKSRENTREAHQRMRPLGAAVAIQAAMQLGECNQLQQIIQELAHTADQRSTIQQQARQALDECQRERARSQCELVSNSRHQGELVPLEIVYINEGLQENRFRDLTEEITSQILQQRTIGEHQRHILFRRTQTNQQLTTHQGHYQAPRADTRATKIASSGCHGDIALVLSDNNFLPATIQGDGYISRPICGSPRCMTTYSIRSLSFAVFNLESEDNTYTGAHTFNPDDVRIIRAFSDHQQTTINNYFNERT